LNALFNLDRFFSNSVSSTRVKLLLLVIGLTIALGTLFYTQNLVEKLQDREREIVELYANSLKYISSSEIVDNDFTFVFENIIKRIDFPLILTDSSNVINSYGSMLGIKNIDIDSTLSEEKKVAIIEEIRQDLAEEHNPITVSHSDERILGRIYYGNSNLVELLKYYPYLQIFFAIIFLLVSYISFSYVKRSEQSSIWVGMAKETAHQLGTPISSLMGWSELLKINHETPEKVIDISEEIDSDLTRLNKIAKRFSKIGSKPELTPTNIFDAIEKVISYFNRRLPHSGKQVDISINGKEDSLAKLNDELFEWVIENLIKNALDAIGSKNGFIKFTISEFENQVIIDVEDSGKGIDHKNRKDVFRPGYSTKKRGWGLGLSLSKRIVENYHQGRIIVKSSILGEGTTFRITLIRQI